MALTKVVLQLSSCAIFLIVVIFYPANFSLINANGVSFKPGAQDYLTDPDPCLKYGRCSQICLKKIGQCKCFDGFNLEQVNPSQWICKHNESEGILLSMTENNLYAQDLTKNIAHTIAVGNLVPYHEYLLEDLRNRMAIDYHDHKIYYWVEQKPPHLVSIELNNINEVVQAIPLNISLPNVQNISGFDVDWMTKNFYFSDSLRKAITVCNRQYCVDLILFQNYAPFEIIVDVINAKIFWVGVHDDGTTSIERAEMDGSGLKTLCISQNYEIRSLALDPFYKLVTSEKKNVVAGRLYFVCNNGGIRSIVTIDSDGTESHVVLRSSFFTNKIRSLSVFADQIYAVNDGFGEVKSSVVKFNRFLPLDQHILPTLATNVVSAHIFHPSLQPLPENNPCSTSPCSHLCVANFDTAVPEKRCVCRTGFFLDVDGVTCQHDNLIILSLGNKLVKFYPQMINSQRNFPFQARPNSMKILEYLGNSSNNLVESLGEISALAINHKYGFLYYADDRYDIIGAVQLRSFQWPNFSMNFSQPVVNEGLVTVKALAVDWVSELLYWLEADLFLPGLWVANLDGSNAKQLIGKELLYEPTSLAVHPLKGYLFFAEKFGFGRIYRCIRNGTACFAIKIATLSPSNLVVDIKRDKIFWSDLAGFPIQQGRINKIGIDGNKFYTVISGLKRIVSITLLYDRLFWIDDTENVVHTVDTDGNNHLMIEAGFHLKITNLIGMDEVPPFAASACSFNNGGCSHLCIPFTHDEWSCHCPFGMSLHDSSKLCSYKQCSKGKFTCNDGKCIPEAYRCDFFSDCVGGDDEIDCIYTCNSSEFTCDNGQCTWSITDKCDGFMDCSDGSDEKHCENRQCNSGLKKCDDGGCIPADFWCDRQTDCNDASDELKCDYPKTQCSLSEYWCESMGKCQVNSWKCDGDYDCPDIHKNINIDEVNCTIKEFEPCNKFEFRCQNDLCINDTLKCDGNEDCQYGEDETEGCVKECLYEEFTCLIGECLEISKRCDFKVDCSNGLDELNCVYQCLDDQFLCGNHCLSNTLVCNGKVDCENGFDEKNCTRTDMQGDCLKDQFECDNSEACIPLSQVCNEKFDCADSSDEGHWCQSSCIHNGGCHGLCQPSPIGPICSCKEGFQLGSDGKQCLDINECLLSLHDCSQLCFNSKGSYHCQCLEGYEESYAISHAGTNEEYVNQDDVNLHNHLYCKAKGHRPFLLIGQDKKVFKIEHVGSDLHEDHHETYYSNLYIEYKLPESRFDLTTTMDFDIENERIIWGFHSKEYVGRIQIDNHSVLIPFNISCLAYDWVTSNIYIGDHSAKAIGVVAPRYEFQTIPAIINNVDVPRSIALDPRRGLMYWTQFDDQGSNSGIFQSSMDGVDIVNLGVVSNTDRPSGLAIDFARDRLLWVNQWTGVIMYATIANHSVSPTVLKTMATYGPTQLDVFEDYVYILNDLFHRVLQFHIHHKEEEINLHQMSWLEPAPYAIKVVHPYRQPSAHNYCEFQPCSMVCVLSSTSFSCPGEGNVVKALMLSKTTQKTVKESPTTTYPASSLSTSTAYSAPSSTTTTYPASSSSTTTTYPASSSSTTTTKTSTVLTSTTNLPTVVKVTSTTPTRTSPIQKHSPMFCHPNPCTNGAQCTESFDHGFNCDCVVGYHGRFCEFYDQITNPELGVGSTFIPRQKVPTSTFHDTFISPRSLIPTNSTRLFATKAIPTDDNNTNSAYKAGKALSSGLDVSVIICIVLGIILLALLIGIFIYVKNHKQSILQNQIFVRFRRPNTQTLDNDDSVDLGDRNNNFSLGAESLAQVIKQKKGKNRLRKMMVSLEKGIVECRDKMISNFKDDPLTASLEENPNQDPLWHTNVEDVPTVRVSSSPAVLPVATGFDFNCQQPVNPPRTILKVFQENPEITNVSRLPTPVKRSMLKKFPAPSKNDLEILSPYLTPACSESEDDDDSWSYIIDEVNPESQRLLI